MPKDRAVAGLHPAIQAGIWVIRSRRGRKMIFALGGGLVLGFAIVSIVLISTVGALVSMCQREAGDGGGSGAGGPSGYVSQEPSKEALSDIPENYLKEYRAAAKQYGIDWAILAAVGKEETDHGRYGGGCASSSAGAMGPMQFMPATWSTVGVDGDGDGRPDACNYKDAIPSAAKYLVDGGAPEDYQNALFQYNNAQWYVDDVLEEAERYRAAAEQQPGGTERAGYGEDSEPEQTAVQPADQPGGWASSSGDEAGQQGWDVVDENGNLHYQLDTSYGDYFESAAREWDSLGGVNIEPSPSASETDVVVSDGYVDGAMGRTYSDGRIVFDPEIMGGATDNARLAAAAHELGHGLNHPHASEESVMRTPVITNTSSNIVRPTGYDRAIHEETWGTADTGGSSGGSSGGRSGGAGPSGEGETKDNAKAVFPLGKKYFDSYDDTWGASRPGGNNHEGADLMAPAGEQIYSVTAGTVQNAEGSSASNYSEVGGYNIMVKASESVGPIQEGDLLYYAHMSGEPEVSEGDSIEAGQVIGKVGSTGYGPEVTDDKMPEHLHFGWYDMSNKRAEAPSGAMNPFPLLEYLKDNGGTATGGDTVAPSGEGLPSYCLPLRGLGIIKGIGERISGLGGGGSGESSDGGGGGPVRGTGTGKEVVAEAEKYLGVRYVLGGSDVCVPGETMDCTCLTTTVFRSFGYDGADALPDYPQALADYGKPVEGEPKAGDVFVYGDPGDGTGGHVAIAMGDGRIIHANMGTMSTSISDSPEAGGDIVATRRLIDE